MIRSLNNGVAGLTSHQVRMDVIGNNIANINTIAFKRSRAAFNEVLAQEFLSLSRSPGGGATNPSFIGLGLRVSSIDKNWTQGALENTNLPTDLAINGDGFFIVKAGDQELLTRAGNFTLNRFGNLINSDGLAVQGFAIDETTGVTDITTLADVQIDLAAAAAPDYTSSVTVGGNLDAAMSDNGGVTPDTFDMSAIVYDEQGNRHTLDFNFEKTSADGADPDVYQVTVSDDAVILPFGGVPSVFDAEFSTDGQLLSIDGVLVTDAAFAWPTITWDAAFVNITGADDLTIDLTTLTQYREATSAIVTDQNGTPSGKLVGYRTNSQGVVQLSFDTGKQQDVYQIALGNVNNVNGLEMLGENLYAPTSVSGEIRKGRAGNEINASVVAGTLEMSNVELATEFTEMIKTQRGFQASARVIRTSDEILTETVNLKR